MGVEKSAFTGGSMSPVKDTDTIALDWAAGILPGADVRRISAHPWARVYRLRYKGARYFLKLVRGATPEAGQALRAMSKRFEPVMPKMLAAAPDEGFYLYHDHQGEQLTQRPGTTDKQAILSKYAAIQSAASKEPALLRGLPAVTPQGLFDRFLELLDDGVAGEDKSNLPGNPFHFMPPEEVRSYRETLQARAAQVRAFLEPAEQIAQTINHCDLRVKNIARRAKGDFCIFDWDDAVAGPPGMSLHAQFSGCLRIHFATTAVNIARGQATRDKQAIDRYLDVLSKDGAYDRAELRAALPASALAGVFYYICGFAHHRISSTSSRKSIAGNARRRMADLGALFQRLDGIAEQKATLAAKAAARAEGDKEVLDDPDVFPYVEFSEDERSKNRLRSGRADECAEIYHRYGALMLRDVFPRGLIAACQQAFKEQSNRYREAIEQGGALRVGDKRFMVTPKMSGAFADPAFFAAPLVLPILRKLLGRNAILGSMTAVASMPGAEEQKLHRDNPPLFEELDRRDLPPFLVSVMVPLIQLNHETGGTRIIKRSQTLRSSEVGDMPSQDPVADLGSCYLMDGNVFHQGMANNSEHIRPVVSLIYQRPWYRDHKNFKKQDPMDISNNTVSNLPSDARKLVEWAV